MGAKSGGDLTASERQAEAYADVGHRDGDGIRKAHADDLAAFRDEGIEGDEGRPLADAVHAHQVARRRFRQRALALGEIFHRDADHSGHGLGS